MYLAGRENMGVVGNELKPVVRQGRKDHQTIIYFGERLRDPCTNHIALQGW